LASTRLLDFATTFTLSREKLLSAVLSIGLANSIAQKVYFRVAEDGLLVSIFKTFDISVIVWIAAYLGVSLVVHGKHKPSSRLDWRFCGAAIAVILLPSSNASWLAVTILSLYIVVTSRFDNSTRRGATIIFALTVPMFWSKQLFTLLSGWILQADAILVSTLVGMKRVGNTIELSDGNGQLWIASGCSSLANLSLAVLCWTVFAQYIDPSKSGRANWIGAIACVLVVGINVGRLCLIALMPENYGLLHGPIGATLVGWMTTLAMVGVFLFGLRRELIA
jgi:hypothetical protein